VITTGSLPVLSGHLRAIARRLGSRGGGPAAGCRRGGERLTTDDCVRAHPASRPAALHLDLDTGQLVTVA
jgi:hypothetical protein